ncbi:MAG TPA: peptidoglycan bridge formation glycyltransferase FemA/FemB family protein [Patescibacteria group bacterium]|nr:peptidoglycan bridge formation glycyltransferase FemA/FemB family protein [Patescibacteria group bacterium]
MIVRPISSSDREAFDAIVTHPLQSYIWGDFRAKTGAVVERIGGFEGTKLADGVTVTFHSVPHTSFTVGYIPKGTMPTESMLAALKDLGKRYNALFIKLEPNISAPVDKPLAHKEIAQFLLANGCVYGKPLFTRYSFVLPLGPTEEELLERMRPKTRYNIKVAQKKGVTVVEDTSESGMKEYLTILAETTKRQQFYAHSPEYFQKMWETLSPTKMIHILKAQFEGKTLAVWILFIYHDTLYYPYGASSREHKEVMANNLLAFEAIKFGKQMGCTAFDMWGALGPNPNPNDPWFGFHKFKEGYGGQLEQTIGTFDFVINHQYYGIFRTLDNLRWKFLRIKAKLGL